ncbi:MAG: adenosylcobalamin-dependent ribonucleoside-diphosphate reductase [Candidatus Woesearchaeota archaeon]|nr:adenosylcobalamin-dependent ribonucleoside-diphosphate reductase [Candidatus Woesearchaeota archaeon]
MAPINSLIKRSGKRVLFNEHRITEAVWKAMQDVGEGTEAQAEKVKELTVKKLEALEKTPTIEDVQDKVEEALIEKKHVNVAKSYILYRNERQQLREQKAALIGGKIDELQLSFNAVKILEQRYLMRDEQGKIKETPSELFWRVANHVAMAELKYNNEPKAVARTFHRMLSNLEFIPSSPTLMNAGTTKQLSSAFAIPIPDDMDGIFESLRQAVVTQKNGGGTGFSFSRIRPKNDTADGVHGVACGPIAVMRIFEASMKAVRQSGRRQGANMAILRVDHPDILDFINLKLAGGMENFNLSVGITDEFMTALQEDGDIELINPRTEKATGTVAARVIFDSILAVAWRCGDPGLVFLDRMQAANPCKHKGTIETTSACGEAPLMPYESACEGSVNLTACVKDGKIDYTKLKKIVTNAVRFLDNVVDVNNYLFKEMEHMTKATRRIGLGLMGFADVLFAIGVPYDTDEAVGVAEKIAQTIQEAAEQASIALAEERGTFPAFKRSAHDKSGKKLRNSVLMAIAPTGTISLLANVSSGIEPNYALAYSRTTESGELLYINPFFEQAMNAHNIEKSVVQEVAKTGVMDEAIPPEMKAVFKTSQQILPEWHIKIQAAFQKYVDGAISKTINYPNDANVKQIEDGYLLAWELGCKGITVYRDGSLDVQVLNTG